MASIREHTINWVLPSGRPGVTVLHYDLTEDASAFNFAVNSAGNALKALMSTGTSIQASGSFRDFDPVTGTMTATGTYTPSAAIFGTSAAEPLPDASAALVQWATGAINAGRTVRGRSFLSGLTTDAVVNGNLSATAVTAVNAWAQALSSYRVIWHRPSVTTVGQAYPVTSHAAWGEFAVLRNRRTR